MSLNKAAIILAFIADSQINTKNTKQNLETMTGPEQSHHKNRAGPVCRITASNSAATSTITVHFTSQLLSSYWL